MTSTPAARAFIIFSGAIVATGVLVIVLLFTTKGDTEKAVDQSQTNFDVLKDQEHILRIILAVTGCTVEDTNEECKARIVEAGRIEGETRIAEIDCRIRLALSGAPAPVKGVPCLALPPTTTTTAPPPPIPPPPPG